VSTNNKSNSKSNSRKNFLINPRFQLSYIKHTVNLMLLTVLIFYAANLYHFWDFKKRGLEAGLPPDHIFFRFLQQQQTSMEIVFIVTAIIAAIFIIAYGVFLSHRVAGPLYRMNRYLEKNKGKINPGELRFRKGDYFSELAENFNNYIKELNKELNK
jgi:hypothetical protein